jgi:hypothetical protein
MENARRWSGFVCPDCRFVFRVPREHDGRGVVCPSCRRLLKVPLPDDATPPLVVPPPSHDGKKKRRKSRSRRLAGHDWESTDDQTHQSSRRTRRQMTWMLAGGAALFALIVAGVMMIMLDGGENIPVLPPPAVQLQLPPEDAASAELSDVALLAAAEPLAGKFLSATSVADLLPLVRNPQTTEARLRSTYPDGKIQAPGLDAFNSTREVIRHGGAMTVKVRTRSLDEKPLTFFTTPEGLKIDWESWAGWSEMPWDEFLATKPVSKKLFRVWLSPVDYYNFAFSDEGKWRSYQLISPDEEHAVYGYVERGSAIDKLLIPSPDAAMTPFTVTLAFPANTTSRNQVIIGKFIAEGWTIETEESP